MDAFLGVSSSLTGRPWAGPDEMSRRAAEAIAQAHALPLPLAAILARSKVLAEEVPGYLEPKLRDLMPDPRQLRDMEAAAARVNRAVAEGERIAVFADYDVDGGASAALLLTWLRALGREPTLYIPDRIDEGYGPNVPAMEQLARAHDLIVCVDCGTLSHEPVAAARGADVVILDHHLGGETLPEAVAVVNPNRQDESGDLGHLCAAGVTFLMLVEARRQRREAGLPAGPDLMMSLDLVALATVADVSPLVGVNRAFVRTGLQVMARRGRPGLAALCDAAGLTTAPTDYHLGYVLGPRINAGGRVGRADLGARLLSTEDAGEAQSLAERLDGLNRERREIEAAVRAAALAQAEARGLEAPLAWAAGEGWHPGVVGIVAARLKEAADRPAVVIGFDGDVGKGSARSVPGVDIGAAMQRLAHEGLIERGGGHRMAAGLTLSREQLEPAMARLEELLATQGAGSFGPRALKLDGMVLPPAATPELVARLSAAGPFGASAPAPRFALPDCRILDARPVGDGHLKLTIGDGTCRLGCIGFGLVESDLGLALLRHAGKRFHLAGRLDLNHWNGRTSAQLMLDDAAPA
ncbi:single-stranded-DNA-specific exonuclease RecJ [Pseudoroseicyclus tamaricis]|uniref:Single-stranded-DNA-specific exonuclease RecJ n=1 Tax=Pseudoroseicyclus tamaricis TaxID=2705421 RepID=A0A6B2JMJ8_9RHOB|nr:single-stranded-DNA-specific exonuclease RecJ [Pseudoroseicyclus tamaricis]NDU99886.1 single-stranded-DNA-specific exonuclease RecJ [Pseudoroseicyclus tamaricis]